MGKLSDICFSYVKRLKISSILRLQLSFLLSLLSSNGSLVSGRGFFPSPTWDSGITGHPGAQDKVKNNHHMSHLDVDIAFGFVITPVFFKLKFKKI